MLQLPTCPAIATGSQLSTQLLRFSPNRRLPLSPERNLPTFIISSLLFLNLNSLPLTPIFIKSTAHLRSWLNLSLKCSQCMVNILADQLGGPLRMLCLSPLITLPQGQRQVLILITVTISQPLQCRHISLNSPNNKHSSSCSLILIITCHGKPLVENEWQNYESIILIPPLSGSSFIYKYFSFYYL